MKEQAAVSECPKCEKKRFISGLCFSCGYRNYLREGEVRIEDPVKVSESDFCKRLCEGAAILAIIGLFVPGEVGWRIFAGWTLLAVLALLADLNIGRGK